MKTIRLLSYIFIASLCVLESCKDDDFEYTSTKAPYDSYKVSIFVSDEDGNNIISSVTSNKIKIYGEESRTDTKFEVTDSCIVFSPDSPDAKNVVEKQAS